MSLKRRTASPLQDTAMEEFRAILQVDAECKDLVIALQGLESKFGVPVLWCCKSHIVNLLKTDLAEQITLTLDLCIVYMAQKFMSTNNFSWAEKI